MLHLVTAREKKSIFHKGRSYTFTQLLQHASRYAAVFQRDCQPKKVLIFAENSAEWIFAFYGVLRCEAIAIPIDVQSTLSEVAYILNDCRPDIVFTTPNKQAMVAKALSQIDYRCVVLTETDIPLDGVETESDKPIRVTNMEQTMLIIYTSGTTGSPKGVMLSYKNVIFNIKSVSESVEIFNEERNTMILLPLHHAFPLIGSLIAPIFVGGTVFIAEGLNAESIVKTLNEGKINIIIGVPRLYELLTKGVMDVINKSWVTRALFGFAKGVGSQRLSRLLFGKVHKKFGGHIDYLVSGGASLPHTIGETLKALGFTVLEGYGMTETAPMISFTRPWNVNVGYAGEPLPGIEVRIADNGEVCVRGDNVMQGYYNRPDETADILYEGWLHTGDIGELSPKKGLKLTGRIKEIIVTPNGKNINPEELEFAIVKHSPMIKEIGIFMKDNVLQCVIVPQMSELRDSTESMEEVLREEIAKFNQTVAPYKRIKNIHIVSGELPKTRLMKVQRFKLADLAEAHRTERADDDTPRSEVYTMLKSFIDKDTGYNAREDDDFEIDLAMDSLSKVALLAFIESSFELNLNEAQLDQLNTLAKLTEHIEHQQHEIKNAADITWKEILTSKVQDFVVPRAGIVQAFCSRTAKGLMHLVYTFRKHGGEEIPDRPCIIVANHNSMLDGYFITSKLKSSIVKHTFFFAKDKHLKSRVAQFLARKNNVILMDINKNVRESLQQMASVLQQNKNIIIFPEGTRSKTGELLPFKESFAILSRELEIPVVPVVISGAERAFFKRVHLPRMFVKITVDFLPPVYPHAETAEELRDKVRNIIANHLADVRKKH